MEKITENANNLAKELISTANVASYIQVVNPTTGKVNNIKISDFASVVAAGVGNALGFKRLDIIANKDTEYKIDIKQNCYIFISSKSIQACAMFYSPSYGDLVLSMMFGNTTIFSETESSGHVFVKRANNELFLVNKKYNTLTFQLIVIEV